MTIGYDNIWPDGTNWRVRILAVYSACIPLGLLMCLVAERRLGFSPTLCRQMWPVTLGLALLVVVPLFALTISAIRNRCSRLPGVYLMVLPLGSILLAPWIIQSSLVIINDAGYTSEAVLHRVTVVDRGGPGLCSSDHSYLEVTSWRNNVSREYILVRNGELNRSILGQSVMQLEVRKGILGVDRVTSYQLFHPPG